jgi:hypothetical protein
MILHSSPPALRSVEEVPSRRAVYYVESPLNMIFDVAPYEWLGSAAVRLEFIKDEVMHDHHFVLRLFVDDLFKCN